MMGIDEDRFWTLNPKSIKPYIKAFSLKRQYDDSLLWQEGLYIRLAIASVMDKDNKYPSKPMLADKVIIHEETPEERQLKIKQKMMEMMTRINARFEQGG